MRIGGEHLAVYVPGKSDNSLIAFGMLNELVT